MIPLIHQDSHSFKKQRQTIHQKRNVSYWVQQTVRDGDYVDAEEISQQPGLTIVEDKRESRAPPSVEEYRKHKLGVVFQTNFPPQTDILIAILKTTQQ